MCVRPLYVNSDARERLPYNRETHTNTYTRRQTHARTLNCARARVYINISAARPSYETPSDLIRL